MTTVDPRASDQLSQLRLALGDTNPRDPYLDDATYLGILASVAGDMAAATRQAAGYAAAQVARRPQRVTADGITVDMSHALAFLQKVAAGQPGTGVQPSAPPRVDLLGSGAVKTEPTW